MAGRAVRVVSSIGAMGVLAPLPGIRGRAAEISVLGEALDRVASGRHAVVLISRRTVQTHLAHVFAKLDISARTQLAAEVTRRKT